MTHVRSQILAQVEVNCGAPCRAAATSAERAYRLRGVGDFAPEVLHL